jgi:hypothetical protein
MEGEKKYSYTLSLISVLDGGKVVKAAPRPLYPPERDPIFIVDYDMNIL